MRHEPRVPTTPRESAASGVAQARGDLRPLVREDLRPLHEKAGLAQQAAGLGPRTVFSLASSATIAHGDHAGVVDGIGCRHL